MKQTIILTLLGALALGLVMIGAAVLNASPAERRASERALLLQAEAASAEAKRTEERRALEHRQALERAQALAPVRTLARAAWELAPLALLGALALVALDAYTQRRRALVYADGAGLVPLPRAFVDGDPRAALALLAEYQSTRGEARVIAAGTPMLPQTLTFAPHHVVKNERPPDLPELLPEARPVPSFGELLSRGELGPGRPVVLGYLADGTPVTGGIGALVSAAIAGTSGSGKTTTTRFLASQLALKDARFVLLDPHAAAGGESLAGTLAPLGGAFLCAPATERRAYGQVVGLVATELERRLRGGSYDNPLLLLCDEFTRVMRELGDDDSLSKLLESIATEGRKVNVFTLLLGQTWSASRAGGSELRDTLASVYVHRIRRRQAQMLLGGGVELPDTLSLATGRALLYRAESGEVEPVTIPNTTAADMAKVGQLLALPAPSPLASVAPSRGAVVTVEARRVEAGPVVAREGAAPASPQAARALAMLRDGASQSEVIREVWKAKGGRAYQQAAEELRAIVASSLGEGS